MALTELIGKIFGIEILRFLTCAHKFKSLFEYFSFNGLGFILNSYTSLFTVLKIPPTNTGFQIISTFCR